jgi:hypothetical protein
MEDSQLIHAAFVDILATCRVYHSKEKPKRIYADTTSVKSCEFFIFYRRRIVSSDRKRTEPNPNRFFKIRSNRTRTTKTRFNSVSDCLAGICVIVQLMGFNV